jgi:hypothetical protein
MVRDDEKRLLERVRAELLAEFGTSVPAELVQRSFDAIVRQYDSATVRDYVAVLAQRQARVELRRTLVAG